MKKPEKENSAGKKPSDLPAKVDTQKEHESPFQSFFSCMPIGANIFDSEGKVIAVNSVARSYFGVSEDDPLTNYRLFEDPSITDETKHKLRNGQSALEERWIDFNAIHQHKMYATKRPADDRVFIRLWYTPDGPDLHNPLGYSVTIQDLTERKHAEEALQNSEVKWKSLFSTLPVGVSLLDNKGAIADFNPALGKILAIDEDGLRNGAYRQRSYVRIDGSPMPSEEFPSVRAVKENRIIQNVEIGVTKENGELVWTKVSAAPLNLPGISCVISTTDITERIETQRTLNDTRDRLALASASAHIGIWDWDIVNNNMIWDDQMFKLYGVTKESSASGVELWQKGLHPDDFSFAWEECQAAMRGVKKYDIEFRVRHPGGVVRWIKADGNVIRDESGKAVRMIGINYDITERKQAEAKIREKDIQFRKLSANVPDLMFQFTRRPDGSYYVPIASDGIKNIFGCSPEDVLEDFTPIGRVIYPEDAERVISDIEYSAKHLTFFTCEFRVHIPGKEIQWIYSRSIPEKLEDGSITWYGFNADITDRKKAEESLQESEERYRALADNGQALIWTAGLDKKCDYFNIPWLAFTGKRIEEELGDGWAKGVHPDDLQRCFDIYVNAFDRREKFSMNYRIQHNSGEYRWIQDDGTPRYNSKGEFIGYIGHCLDITDRKRAEEALSTVQKLESLGLLAGGIAHDFNNLMGGIFGYMDMASDSTKDDRVRLYLSKGMNTIDRARALTQQLLTFAKGGAPIQEIGYLFPFIEETAKFALSGANVSCHFDVPQDLWACNFDKNQIGQVIDNLIINAQQAMPIGGTIELSARNIALAEKEHPLLINGNYVKISVKDTGVGIPKEHISKIFDPFFTTKAKGHGLGLATCYSIIHRHGGCIEVESEPGKGSTFKVYLPASMESASAAIKNTAKTHKGSGTFLVMDDEEVMRDTIGEMLEALGYTVVSKESGQEAVAYFATETKANRKITGMIFDLTVPGGMGGKAAIGEIRKTNTEIPAFVASGYADDPVMKNPTEYGFMASICKPFRKSELSEMLERYLKSKK